MSHPDRVARTLLVNVLIGSFQRANRPARENEVVLNSEWTLDFQRRLQQQFLAVLVDFDAGGFNSSNCGFYTAMLLVWPVAW